jgi:hypothetical protein
MKKILLSIFVLSIGLILSTIMFYHIYSTKRKIEDSKEPHYVLTYDLACETKITTHNNIHLKDTCYGEMGTISLYHEKIIINGEKEYLIRKSENKEDHVILYCEDEEAKRFLITLKFVVGGSLSIAENSELNPLILNIKAYSIREIN